MILKDCCHDVVWHPVRSKRLKVLLNRHNVERQTACPAVPSCRIAIPFSLNRSPFEGLAINPERLLCKMNGLPERNGDQLRFAPQQQTQPTR
ncbi:hypothetical protein QA635_32655 [Bradyrhizobium brasilense]|uniref:hypothetical protein n=1 Tax=Bradyrhizobium brasilense TaxID=1419277 RepID=UPI0024B2152E|nr:hypothetical protein [Bradyrhizobium australafricanum]WFU31274.1 hypothetical protein QA635_32655 [Bradyrhizobium australafricanum]